jgi:hypothetical protein
MKQGQGVQAYKALRKIMAQDTSLPVSKKVFDLQEKLQPIWDFQLSEEQKIALRHPIVDPRTASVHYKTDDEEEKQKALDELDAFTKELEALSELETEVSITPFTIHMDEENIKIAGNDVKALKGIIEFE